MKSMFLKKKSGIRLWIAICAVIFTMAPFFPVLAASAAAAGDEEAVPSAAAGDAAVIEEANAATATATSTAAKPVATLPLAQPKRSLSDVVSTAEKMYYCGELYIFADSMTKTNYEIASISTNLTSSLKGNALAKSAATIKSLVKTYNGISEAYNSWVDVKGDLEYYIDTAGTRNTITKSQLQTAFKKTLSALNEAQELLEAAQAYAAEPTPAAKRALASGADSLLKTAASAVNAILPMEAKTLAGYRNLFDSFAKQAGLKIEYKTWQNPETQNQDAQNPETQNP